ncbi:hypothetical protein Syun_003176 [Stephania yunnanensis]|uniref:Uncharacterized protein n=1 Tax=Stephania yunnanensis TaxID=152371 RepID=A0AAP0L2S4_9MAGN
MATALPSLFAALSFTSDLHFCSLWQLVDSSLTLVWVSLLFILDDDMVQGEWGLACTVKTAAFSLVVLLHFWTDVTISIAWLSIGLMNGVVLNCSSPNATYTACLQDQSLAHLQLKSSSSKFMVLEAQYKLLFVGWCYMPTAFVYLYSHAYLNLSGST